MKKIKLTKGFETIVDDGDFDHLNKFKWCLSKGAAVRRENYIMVYMHRLLLGAKSGEVVDHISGDSLDNRRANLRLCSQRENAKNRKKSRRNVSGYKGVCWNKKDNRWLATITINYKHKYVGQFKTKEDAARAYNEAAKKLYGEFARLNEL